MQLFKNSSLIMWLAVFQDPLNHPTAVRMSGKNVDLTSKSFNDKLDVFGGNSLDGFLYNVITILILHTLENIGSKFLSELGLLIG